MPIKFIVFAIMLLLPSIRFLGQNLNPTIIANIETHINSPSITKKKFIERHPKKWRNYLPSRYVFGSLLYLYQNTISEQISANCAYQLSCSEFSKKSLKKFGLLKGILLTSHRLMSCNHKSIIDYPDYKKNEQLKIQDDFEDY
jgi:putative component of membrane protein insertase Oxa1/YidC/SpoIIIJ protein YidD